MKKQFITITLVTASLILTVCCGQNNKHENKNNMDKNMMENKTEQDMNNSQPENTLAVFEINDKTVYLLNVELIKREDSEYAAYTIDHNTTGNGDYFIQYSTISGNYPKDYNEASSDLHIIPQNDIFKFEKRLQGLAFYYEENNIVETAFPSFEWEFIGYSNDKNLLETKILEYYLETVKNNVNENVTKSRTKKTPKGTLATFANLDGTPKYLTEIKNITKDDSVLQDFVDSYTYIGYIGNGDYFVTLKTVEGDYPYEYVVKKYIMHIIPQNNTSTFEVQFVSDTNYTNGKIDEQGEVSYGWLFGWAHEDELDEWHPYIKMFEYVKKWKKINK